jgi:aspartyl-tRNA(Asn)/glutamyl-tRNA(Gln) amidotransferase subunit C
MSLSLEEVRRIAMLARIEVTDAEIPSVQEKLNGILGMIAEMQSVDTTGIEPMSHALDLAQRLRPDVVTETNQRAAFQAVAPETEGGLYLVPKVIE